MKYRSRRRRPAPRCRPGRPRRRGRSGRNRPEKPRGSRSGRRGRPSRRGRPGHRQRPRDMGVEEKTVHGLEGGELKTEAYLGVDVDVDVKVHVSETTDANEASLPWCFGRWTTIRITWAQILSMLQLARLSQFCIPKFRPFTFCQ